MPGVSATSARSTVHVPSTFLLPLTTDSSRTWLHGMTPGGKVRLSTCSTSKTTVSSACAGLVPFSAAASRTGAPRTALVLFTALPMRAVIEASAASTALGMYSSSILMRTMAPSSISRSGMIWSHSKRTTTSPRCSPLTVEAALAGSTSGPSRGIGCSDHRSRSMTFLGLTYPKRSCDLRGPQSCTSMRSRCSRSYTKKSLYSPVDQTGSHVLYTTEDLHSSADNMSLMYGSLVALLKKCQSTPVSSLARSGVTRSTPAGLGSLSSALSTTSSSLTKGTCSTFGKTRISAMEPLMMPLTRLCSNAKSAILARPSNVASTFGGSRKYATTPPTTGNVSSKGSSRTTSSPSTLSDRTPAFIPVPESVISMRTLSLSLAAWRAMPTRSSRPCRSRSERRHGASQTSTKRTMGICFPSVKTLKYRPLVALDNAWTLPSTCSLTIFRRAESTLGQIRRSSRSTHAMEVLRERRRRGRMSSSLGDRSTCS
mmetsp:Transcript_50314/g.153003  ORF Transcript_50314/g.153003 Transcript_50314/m.153003 type:complete len:484 (+) Transcript_50314:243-1694(+)